MMKKKITSMGGVCEGDVLNLAKFGLSTVKKIYRHHDTKEYCVEVRAQQGELLHLSLKYAYSRKFLSSLVNDKTGESKS